MRQVLLPFVAGGLFGAGLSVAGMTQPAKVVGFLDFLGAWDPSLAFVMMGAIAAYAPLHRWVLRRPRPYFGARHLMPTRKDLDGKLLGGAALFGVGWGLAGFCPGPALASLGSGGPHVLLFVAAMFAGMFTQHLTSRWFSRGPSSERPASPRVG